MTPGSTRQAQQATRDAQELEANIDRSVTWIEELAPPARTIVLAVSGGVDSVVLAHLMAERAGAKNWSLHIAHFDHGLRPESADEAQFVREWAARLGQPFHTQRWQPQIRYRNGLEAAARSARYHFLARVARAVTPADETPTALTAHQRNDQAETVLLNLMRSGDVHSLAAMRWISEMPEQGRGRRVRLVRPMLTWSRASVHMYAALYGLSWCEDATNALPDRPRTIIRHRVLPELERINPRAVERLYRAAQLMGMTAAGLDMSLSSLEAAALIDQEPGVRAVFSLGPLLQMWDGFREQVLSRTVRRVLPGMTEWGQPQAWPLAKALEGPIAATGPHPLINGYVWTVLAAFGGRPDLLCIHHGSVLPIEPETPWLQDPEHVAARPVPLDGAVQLLSGWKLRTDIVAAPAVLVGASPWEAFLDADRCGEPALTGWKAGMRVAPLGLSGHTRALGDIFTDRKVPAAFRSGWPVLIEQTTGRVLWLCGLAVSQEAAVTQKTRRILRLRFRKQEQP